MQDHPILKHFLDHLIPAASNFLNAAGPAISQMNPWAGLAVAVLKPILTGMAIAISQQQGNQP